MYRILLTGTIGLAVLVTTPVLAKQTDQVSIDPDTHEMVSNDSTPRDDSQTHSSEAESAEVTGVKPKAEPEPQVRQGPRGGTMVETPDYMKAHVKAHHHIKTEGDHDE